jgi:hypothetical protein
MTEKEFKEFIKRSKDESEKNTKEFFKAVKAIEEGL